MVDLRVVTEARLELSAEVDVVAGLDTVLEVMPVPELEVVVVMIKLAMLTSGLNEARSSSRSDCPFPVVAVVNVRVGSMCAEHVDGAGSGSASESFDLGDCT